MIGIVVIAHGGLARELLAATEHVVGSLEQAAAVATGPSDDLAAKQAELDAAVASVDGGSGVVVATDMFGGTPCNLAIGAMTETRIEVVYGANLPMLVRLARARNMTAAEAAADAIEAGRRYIDSARAMLEGGRS